MKQTEIAKELNITPVLDKIQKYRRNWLQHTNRMTLMYYREYQKTTDEQVEETGRDY